MSDYINLTESETGRTALVNITRIGLVLEKVYGSEVYIDNLELPMLVDEHHLEILKRIENAQDEW